MVAPGLAVLDDAAARNLLDYVKGGGHLILGQRSGIKDADNSLQANRQPGPLMDMLGARVEHFYALDAPVPVEGMGTSSTSKLWAEQLAVASPDTSVLLRYGASNGWLDGQPAALTRKVGKGRITYLGAWLQDADEHGSQTFFQWATTISGVKPAFGEVPQDVEVYPRTRADGRKIFIFVNFSQSDQKVTLPQEMPGRWRAMTQPAIRASLRGEACGGRRLAPLRPAALRLPHSLYA